MINLSYRLKFKNCPPILSAQLEKFMAQLLKYVLVSSSVYETKASVEPCRSGQDLEPVSQEINTRLTSTCGKFGLKRLIWDHKKLTERKNPSIPKRHSVTQISRYDLPSHSPLSINFTFSSFWKIWQPTLILSSNS